MPVGMTLQQLYSQPTYHNDPMTSGPLSMSMASSAPLTNSTTATSASSVGAKRPGNINTSAPPRAVAPYQDHMQQQQQHYASSYGQQQLPPPHTYSQQQYHQPKGADEYGLADPLPFEYMGMRKGDQQQQQQQQDNRYASAPAYPPTNYSTHSPHPSVYDSHQQMHPPKTVEDRAYHQPSYDRNAYADGASAHFQNHSAMPSHLYAAATSGPMTSTTMNQHTSASSSHHSFPPLLDAQNLKKEGDRNGMPPQSYSPHGPVEYASTSVSAPMVSAPGGATQEAVIKVKTPLKTKYWRNGRRNLQCFPSCKVFGDYSSIKIEDLKQHDFMWGKCRGSLITEVSLNSSVSFDDILILGRVHSLENVPVAFEEAVIRECMLGRMVEPDVMDGMKDQWITGERLPDFVQQDGNTACYEFKPKVWKYTEDMTQGKCKRRNVKYYVQFEAFVLVMSGERRYYACIGSGMSTAFEVGSSRVLARQKRKASTGLDANPLYMKGPNGQSSPTDSIGPGPVTMQQQHPMMMPQHAMHSQMYQQPQYAPPPQAYPQAPRGMPMQQQHPSMMNQMHHGDNGVPFNYHPAQMQQQQPQQISQPHQQVQAPQAAIGQKRKASGGAGGARLTKAKKTKDAGM